MSEQTPDGGSPCLVFREIPYDYLVDFGTNLINSKNNQIYPAWREDHKDIMVLINNLLAESFIKAVLFLLSNLLSVVTNVLVTRH